jgi:hypothetical protein
MKAEYKNKLPQWYTSNEQFDLILSDDIDSLAACNILQQFKGWNIEYFYRFDGMGVTKGATNEAVGVDIALYNGKTFDNHVTMLHRNDYYNPESINLNVMDRINRNCYFDKFCGSTLMTVWSLYDLPLPESEEGKMILLAIDSTYMGYYNTFPKPRLANKHYLCDVLGFEELYDLQQSHKAWEFANLNSKYNLKSKIKTDKGILTTDIKLDEVSELLGIPLIMPKNTFYRYKDFYNIELPLNPNSRNTMKLTDVCENIFSNAVKGIDKIKYSTEKELESDI